VLELAFAGVQLDPHESLLLDWLAGWGIETVFTLSDLVSRARSLGQASANIDPGWLDGGP